MALSEVRISPEMATATNQVQVTNGHRSQDQDYAKTIFGATDGKNPEQVEDESKTCGKILVVLSWVIVVLTMPFSLLVCFKVVQEYERAVIFRLGRLLSGGAKGPGIFFILPCIDAYARVDLRTRTYDIPPQEVLTKDSVTVSVDAVVYYRVSNATVSIANVENAHHSTRLLAQTTLRNIMGQRPLHEILSERESISQHMKSLLDEATDSWGINVERVEIKDVRLPIQLQRAMAAEAEAAREARAKVIAAEGEQKASRALREASEVIGDSPAALQLRYLQQQHEQFIGPPYDPSRDLSPNLPSCDSSMGDVDPSISSGSSCSTPSNNNHHHSSCTSDICRPHLQSDCRQHQHQHQGPDVCRTPAELCGGPHGSFEHQIPKLEPLQPPRTPPTPPSNADEAAVCAGCGLRIADRFYLQAVDRRWHAACLQCCQCRNTLDGEITCFSRDGNIYCKKDYYRLFGMKRCARCQATILSSELVMRARELVFHVHCFSCAICNSPLTKGDHFGMRDGAVLCRLHFEMALSEPHPAMFPSMYPSPYPSPDFHHHNPLPPPTPVETSVGKVPFFNGAPSTPRQKGRPRKRKPKDLEAMTANLDLNSDYLDMSFGRSPGTPGMPGSNQRTKRMRTSFKHHQLRTMKSYFAINHNPDAKDLKQLSQKTGLPKRVLQVWFQNARAKWRRMMLKQEGKSGEKCSGSEGLSDMDLYPGPGSMSGSIQSLNPHSPPFMLPSGSPSSSLDCS